MIFYFSGTGNTRWAAETLAQTTNERLFFIPEELHTPCEYTLADGERIGFCFPVHGWQPPRIVRRFVERLTLRSSSSARHYAYALCTCGDSIGQAMDMLRRQLEQKDIQLASTLSLVMPESYVCLPFMYTDTPQREREKITAADAELNAFCDVVLQRRQGYNHLVRGAAPWMMSHVIGGYFNNRMVHDRKFTVDADVCTHCGLCAKVCPVGDIDFSGTPQWKHDDSCTSCLSCYHHCPVHAINYGSITRKRGQYYFKGVPKES